MSWCNGLYREVDLQIFMKKAWVYNNAWGVVAWHQGRVSDFVFADQARLAQEVLLSHGD